MDLLFAVFMGIQIVVGYIMYYISEFIASLGIISILILVSLIVLYIYLQKRLGEISSGVKILLLATIIIFLFGSGLYLYNVFYRLF